MKKNVSNLNPLTKKNLITLLMCVVIFAIVQIWQASGSMGSLYQGLLVPICIYIIMAVSLNLVVGYLGELSLGHAGFMCVGAYVSSMFSIMTQNTIDNSLLRFTLAILIGGICAAIFGIIVGIPVLRLRGDYLAIVTLAFGEIIKNIVNVLYVGVDNNGIHVSIENSANLNLDYANGGKMILNGPQGITGTPRDSTFLIGFILVMITLIVIMNFVNSRTGRAITAIRDNRIAAASVGINVTKYKLIAFALAAFFAGVAGALYSHNTASLSATTKNFGYMMSIMVLVYVVLGGMASLRGSVIATIILYALPEVLRQFNDNINNYRMLIYAIILIIMMIINNNDTIKDKLNIFRSKFKRKKVPKETKGAEV